jgi:hypothetical protein
MFILKIINTVLGFLPFNGKKTALSLGLIALSWVLRLTGLELPVDISTINPDEVERRIIDLMDALSYFLELLGFTGVTIGGTHKVTKTAEKILTRPQWEK